MSTPDVLDRFLACAEAAPSASAVLEDDRSWTYGELRDLARRFATLIATAGSRRVLIALPQCAEAYAAMIGAGLAGAVYAPVNIAVPAEKLQKIIRLFEPDLIVADIQRRALLDQIERTGRVVAPAAAMQAAPLTGSGERGHGAYVMFTSGTTGEPKGVAISRAALNHYIAWAVPALRLGPADRVSQYLNLGFDVSVLEIFGTLCAGAALCPFSRTRDRLMPARKILSAGLTVWISVPSVFSLIIKSRKATPAFLSSLRLFLFCGEPLLANQVEAVFAACPDVELHNTYGPTETTVAVTDLQLTPHTWRDKIRGSVALGAPIPDMSLHLLGGPTPDEGEIVITGPQLADGYWRDEDRSSRAFRRIAIGGAETPAYFTGDWAERIGGELYFRERIDRQVKIRGHRIELGAVATAIHECGWPAAYVVKERDTLVAVVERRRGAPFDEVELRRALARKIEAYAIPEKFVLLDELPRNANGKLDLVLPAG